MAAEVGRWVHGDEVAAAALVEARDLDREPMVRKKAGWYAPGDPSTSGLPRVSLSRAARH
jgi:hypothetical protein